MAICCTCQGEVSSPEPTKTIEHPQGFMIRGVVLAGPSACETGVGRTACGKGIIGMQRALQLAGAHTTIKSLWQIDDAVSPPIGLRSSCLAIGVSVTP